MSRPQGHREPGEGCLTLALGDALRPALSLPAVDTKANLTRELTAHAIHRHRVAPLLHAALGKGEGLVPTDENALADLRAGLRRSVVKKIRCEAAERRAVAALEEKGIPFAILKGSGLAAQLYGDPTLRTAKDLDILIPPDRARDAVRVFRRPGYRYRPYTVKSGKFASRSRQHQDMLIHKDLTFFDEQFSVPIELHRRLFKFEPRGLTRDFTASPGFVSTPSLNDAHYCLYLVLHGAISFWHRLKWVADLSILLRRTGAQGMDEMLALAERHGCSEAVISSAILAERVFPGSLDAHWSEAVERRRDRPQVDLLLSHYWQTLTGPLDRPVRLPLKS